MKQSDRIFDDHIHLSVEDVTTKVSELVKSNLQLMEKDEDLSKWTVLPNVLIDSVNNKKKFIEITTYIDELMITVPEKIKLINTVAAMLVTAKIEISILDVNNLFLLCYYFMNIKVDQYNKEYLLLSNQTLLHKIRKQTLDIEKRKTLLAYIINWAKEKNITAEEQPKVSLFQEEVINILTSKSVDEILEIENYMNGLNTQTVDFRDSLNS